MKSLVESILDSTFTDVADAAANNYLKNNPTTQVTLHEFLTDEKWKKIAKKLLGKYLKGKRVYDVSIPLKDGFLHSKSRMVNSHIIHYMTLFSSSMDWPRSVGVWDKCVDSYGFDIRLDTTSLVEDVLKDWLDQEDKLIQNKV